MERRRSEPLSPSTVLAVRVLIVLAAVIALIFVANGDWPVAAVLLLTELIVMSVQPRHHVLQVIGRA